MTDKLLHVFEIENAKALWLMAILVTVVNGLAALPAPVLGARRSGRYSRGPGP